MPFKHWLMTPGSSRGTTCSRTSVTSRSWRVEAPPSRCPTSQRFRRLSRTRSRANPADLVALVAEELEMLAAQIRRGNTDDWRQYWNEDGRRRVVRPKHEESCRDALLSDLRQRLPDGVDAQPEAQYTHGNRADIRVSFNGHGIPVEIKKDSHRRLWSAIADQLVAKYTSAPESFGYGIYLVLWFGGADMPVPPSGRRPKTPGELSKRLEGQLADPWRHRVRVIVIDVSGESEA